MIRMLLAGAAAMLCASSASAEPQPFQVTSCSTATVTRLHEAEGLLLWSLDAKGITMSADENGPLHNMTFQCAVVGRTVAGKPSGTGVCKYMDPDGDTVSWEVTVDGPEDSLRAIQGTGKWKGIKAEGSAVLLTKAKPIAPDLRQVCRRFKGKLELPRSAS
jgi:hypothetical protein